MPKSTVTVPNPFGQQAALERLQQFLPTVKERFQDQISDLTQSWNGNTGDFSFRTFGLTVAGQIVVGESDVQVTLDLPLAAMMVKGRIEQAIRDDLGKLLAAIVVISLREMKGGE